MKVVNNKKAQARTYILNDLKSNSTNLMDLSNKIQENIALLNDALGGSLDGIDMETIGYCKTAMMNISQALQRINNAAMLVNSIDVTEEIGE